MLHNICLFGNRQITFIEIFVKVSPIFKNSYKKKFLEKIVLDYIFIHFDYCQNSI
jgi:hypothetical protein